MRKLLIILLLLIPSLALAADQTVTTCTSANVQSAINTANAGDTVFLDCATGTWASTVNLNKGVTVRGRGATSTAITLTGASWFNITGTSGNYRVSGFGLTGNSSSGTDISIDGNFTSLRIDHLNITTSSDRFVWIGRQANWNDLYSGIFQDQQKYLFDNINYAPPASQQFMLLYGRSWRAWAEADGYGTNNFVFIEDSTFTWTGDNLRWIIDTEGGGRYVFRHNTVTNGDVQMHDFAGFLAMRQRGNRLVEIYNNTLTCSGAACSSWPALVSRGGTGVYYNNAIAGFYFPSMVEIYRLAYSNGLGGNCASSGATRFCLDVQRHCSGAPYSRCYDDSNCSGQGTCGSQTACTTSADCGAGGVCAQIDGSGPNGYPCRDQTGRGQDDPVTGVQVASPLYWWSNTSNGSPIGFDASNAASHVIENRDYCNHSPATTCGEKAGWTYTAYPYPHPWREDGGEDPDPPDPEPTGLILPWVITGG